MKTLDQIAKTYKSETLDGRDLNRLAQFIPAERLEEFGLELKTDITPEDWNKRVLPLTNENILIRLEKDVEFGFENPIGDDTGSEDKYNEEY